MIKRILSAIVALIIFVPLLIIGKIYFELAMLVLAGFAYKEILNLKESHNKIPLFMQLVGGLLMFIFILLNNKEASLCTGITYQLMAEIALLALLPIIFYDDSEYNSKDAFYLISTIVFLGLAFNVLIVLRNRGLYSFLWLISIPMLNDIFAYLVGISIGKHKISEISPKKTLEGSLGGLILGSILSLVIYHLLIGKINIYIILLTLGLSLVGQLGDLVLSKIKRENKIKDFSNIMPGHGGVLDRLDSIIFVCLTYMILVFV